MSKRCIFHIPNALDKNRPSASQIRPKKMKEAFEGIGYEVDAVWGTAKERKQAIRKIKQRIGRGVKYDFMYSESSTMPTLLTECHHMPTHPFLDFSFFSFIKRHGIKIGLFYRDMYWKFPEYKKNVPGIRGHLAVLMYQYDLYRYNRLLTKFYMPSMYGARYLKKEIGSELMDSLPPACEGHNNLGGEKKEAGQLSLLYIGGLGGHYQIHKVLEAVKGLDDIFVTVCCREEEWKAVLPEYQAFLGSHIKIVHKKGKELEDLYGAADICLNFFGENAYMEMAVPFKVFEYLSYGKPIISSSRTVAGEFVEQNGVGWAIEYSKGALMDLLIFLQQNPGEVERKKATCIEKILDNTWERRAEKVAKDLQ